MTTVRGVFAGLATVDCVHRVERMPGPDEKVTALAQELAAGGPAANAAVTFAALGGRATLVTALGGHPLARFAADELVGQGVRVVDAAVSRQEPPAVSAVRVEVGTGRRSVSSVDLSSLTGPDAHLGTDLGPGPGLDVDTVTAECVDAAVVGSEVVLLDGHHPRLALAAARSARAYGVLVVLDGGSWKPVLAELLGLVDVAVCSAVFRVPGTGSSEESLAALIESGIPAAAVTAGSDPVRWVAGGRSGGVPVPPVDAVDTLGAGDVFHGALARALAGGGKVVEPRHFVGALSFAAEVAALRCRTPGPRAWLTDPALARLAVRGPARD